MGTKEKQKNVFIMLCILIACAFSLALFLISYLSGTVFARGTAEAESAFMASAGTKPVELALKEDPPEPDPPAPPEEPDKPVFPVPFTYRGHKRLNIRSTPSLGNNIIGKIYPGTWGTITGVANEKWMNVEYEGTTGYSYTYYLIYDTSLIEP